MKVEQAIKQLQEFNPEAGIPVSTGNTFDDVLDFAFSWGGPTSGDGEKKEWTKYVYININEDKEKEQ